MRAALLAQLGGVAAIALLLFALPRQFGVDPQPIRLMLAMLQGGIAAIIAYRQGAPRWWLVIHLGFAPLVVFVHHLDIPPGWFLAGFVLLLLLFWRTDKSRVPLYLTNRATSDALLRLLPPRPCRVIDIGCGNGGLLRRLASTRPDCHFTGIEHAPLPWLLARLRTLNAQNITIRHGDFWLEPLSTYDVIYAFLSPAPMSRLWTKACAELQPGAILVSNSFSVPDQHPVQITQVKDRRGTQLYSYQPHRAQQDGDFAAFPAIPHRTDKE